MTWYSYDQEDIFEDWDDEDQEDSKYVDDLLLSDEHHYKIYTTNNKPSVELSLSAFPIYLKEHYYILNDMITIIKDAYKFEDVYINIVDTEDKDFIDLKIYMVL